MLLENISVVLVEPQGDRNVGSVARAMMNFGFNDLRLVNPQTDHLSHGARQMAVKAGALLEGASLYPDLAGALADCRLALGTTRRFGKYREEFLLPEEAAMHLGPVTLEGRGALVFGREDSGLLTSELDLCQRFLTIPTDERLPSMNLAQAAALCLYEVSRGERGRSALPAPRESAPVEALEAMYTHMRRTLVDVGYLDPQNPDHILRSFRRIFGRAELDPREVRILQGLWSRLDWVEGERRRLGSSSEERP